MFSFILGCIVGSIVTLAYLAYRAKQTGTTPPTDDNHPFP
jgi:hypothetical protein